MEQLPAVQLGVPFSELHAMLQSPQCSASVARLVSQTVLGSESHSSNPPIQLNPHIALAQVRMALG